MTNTIQKIRLATWPLLVGGVVLLIISTGCGKGGARGFSGSLTDGSEVDAPSGIPNNPYSSSFVNGLNNTLNNSDVSPADRTSLQNYVQNAGDVNPALMDEAFNARLKEEMKKVLDAEKKGLDQTAQRNQLAARAVQACSEKTAALLPRPGQPLIGEYGAILCGADSQQKKKKKRQDPPAPGEIRFSISEEGAIPGQNGQPMVSYSVSGGISGKGSGRPDGTVAIDAGDWQGFVSDRTGFKGELYNAKFKKKGNAYDTCTIKPALIRSANPIPINYAEYIREVGLCYKRAIAFMSPAMSGMFDGMDPMLAQFLQMRMLGLN